MSSSDGARPSKSGSAAGGLSGPPQIGRKTIMREFVTAGLGIWLVQSAVKLLLLTPKLYHSPNMEGYQSWLLVVAGNQTRNSSSASSSGLPFWVEDIHSWYHNVSLQHGASGGGAQMPLAPLAALIFCVVARVLCPALNGAIVIVLALLGVPVAEQPIFSVELLATNVEGSNAGEMWMRCLNLLLADWPQTFAVTSFFVFLVRQVKGRNLKPDTHAGSASGQSPSVPHGELPPSAKASIRVDEIGRVRELGWLLYSLPPIHQPWLNGIAISIVLITTLHSAYLLLDSAYFSFSGMVMAWQLLGGWMILMGYPASGVFLLGTLPFLHPACLWYFPGILAWILWLFYNRTQGDRAGDTGSDSDSSPNRGVRVLCAAFLVLRCSLALIAGIGFALAPFLLSTTLAVRGSHCQQYSSCDSLKPFAQLTWPETVSEMLQWDNLIATANLFIPIFRAEHDYNLLAPYWTGNVYAPAALVDQLICKYQLWKWIPSAVVEAIAGPRTDLSTFQCPASIAGLRVPEVFAGGTLPLSSSADLASLPVFSVFPTVTFTSSVLYVALPTFAALCVYHYRRIVRMLRLGQTHKTQLPPDSIRRSMNDLRMLLWLMYGSVGASFFCVYSGTPWLIVLVLLPVLLLCMIAIARLIETQKHLRLSLTELVQHYITNYNNQANASQNLIPVHQRLTRQMNQYSSAVRRVRMLVGLAIVISGGATLSIFPFFPRVREAPLKYLLFAGHLACMWMMDKRICSDCLRNFEAIGLLCLDQGVLSVAKQRMSVATVPLLSKTEKCNFYFALVPMALWADFSVFYANGTQERMLLPFACLSVLCFISAVRAVLFKGLRVAGV